MVVPDGAAGLDDVAHAALAGPLHVVAEGEEGVGAHGNAGLGGDPRLFLLRGEHLGLNFEGVLPHALGQHVLVLVGDVHVDGVVPVGAADAVHELEIQHLGVLPQQPVVRLAARQAGAVDAALLAGAHADGLAVLHVADGVGLGVLEGDEGHQHVPFGVVRQLLVVGDDVVQQRLVDGEVVAALLKGDAEHVLVLHLPGHIIRVDLHHVVAALALGLQDLQGLVGVAGGNHSVGHLQGQIAGGGGVAHVGQGGPVAVGAQPVGPPGPHIGAGDGGELHALGEVDLLLHVAQGGANGGAGGGDVLEGRGGGQAGGLLQLLHQLPGVEGVQEVDIPRLAVEHLDGQLALLHEDAGGLLVGVAAVFQFQFSHAQTSVQSQLCLFLITLSHWPLLRSM